MPSVSCRVNYPSRDSYLSKLLLEALDLAVLGMELLGVFHDVSGVLSGEILPYLLLRISRGKGLL